MQFPHGDTLLSSSATPRIVLDAMVDLIYQGASHPFFPELTAYLCANTHTKKELLFQIYCLCCKKLKFTLDSPTHQTIRSAKRSLLIDKKGNCVDATILIGTLLQCAGIPFYIRRIALSKNKKLDHVYIVTTDNYVLDACMFWQRKNSLSKAFNSEIKRRNLVVDTLIPEL